MQLILQGFDFTNEDTNVQLGTVFWCAEKERSSPL